jgi:hypothetical protein
VPAGSSAPILTGRAAIDRVLSAPASSVNHSAATCDRKTEHLDDDSCLESAELDSPLTVHPLSKEKSVNCADEISLRLLEETSSASSKSTSVSSGSSPELNGANSSSSSSAEHNKSETKVFQQLVIGELSLLLQSRVNRLGEISTFGRFSTALFLIWSAYLVKG